MRGVKNVLYDIVSDLRDLNSLVSQLPERQAIYQGHPTEGRGYPVAVVVSPIHDGSELHRGATTRIYRVQVAVTATLEWREGKEPDPGGLFAMHSIMDEVAERMDRAKGMQEIPLGGEGGPQPMVTEDGRLAITTDWRSQGTYLE